jgi:hypothetical protein
MVAKDWKAEAQRLLAAAVGTNDNAINLCGDKHGSTTFVFQAPVTVLSVTMAGEACDSSNLAQQRQTLIDRLQGFLASEGERVEEAFRDELRRAFGRDSVADMDDAQLKYLLIRFNEVMRIARMLAVTPKR